MTMVTASTSLTIFIMNIHFCGAEAKPVPHWAKVLIIDYMSKIFFVYEVGENCASSASSSSSAHVPQEDAHQKHLSSHANGKPGGHRSQISRTPSQRHITKDDMNHLSGYKGSTGKIPTGDFCKADQTMLYYPEEPTRSCSPEDKNPRGPVVTFGPCMFCSYGSSVAALDNKLGRNVEYIANCFREQRATCAKVAEWKKVAKVMDRFFMWLFFIMVFLMSILVIGKAQ